MQQQNFGHQLLFSAQSSKAVLEFLWFINDASTSLLMQQFYTNLANSSQPRTQSEVLRQAQLGLLIDKTATEIASDRTTLQ